MYIIPKENEVWRRLRDADAAVGFRRIGMIADLGLLKENEAWRRLRDAVLLAQRSPIEFNLARVRFLERRLVKIMESGDDSREFFRSW